MSVLEPSDPTAVAASAAGPGHPDRLVRWPAPARPATDRDVERLVDRALEGTEDPNRRAAARARLEAVPHAASTMAYTELRADDEGRLWVLPYIPPWDHDGTPIPWHVFDPDALRGWRSDTRIAAPPFRDSSVGRASDC